MLIENTREVSTNIQDTTKFGISSNSAKLFSMLGHLLYSDKERTVLTELSSNALDAHKLVGKENEPIHVQLPTSLVPEVRVRDFGPGLSEENVIRFLTTYGESSKQGSNDFIGGFGIGSKSPSAVTDTWTINSHHDGVHKQYLIFIDASGIPNIKKMVEKATGESGLEIIIPTKANSVQTWITAAHRTYQHYTVRPIIKGQQVSFNDAAKIFFSSDNGFTTSEYFCGTLKVLINHRMYTIQTSHFTLSPLQDTLRRNTSICLKMSVGDIELSLSREDVQYTKKTCNAIVAKFDAFINDIEKKYQTEVVSKKFDHEIEFNLAVCKMLTDADVHIPQMYNHLTSGHKMYNPQLTTDSRCKLPLNHNFIESGRVKQANSAMVEKLSKVRGNITSARQWVNGACEYGVSFNKHHIDNAVFVYNDNASFINERVKHSFPDKDVLILDDDFSFLPAFLKSKVHKASTLARPKKEKKVVTKVKSDLYAISGYKFVKVESDVYDSVSKLFYVEFTNATSITSADCHDIKELMQTASRLGYTLCGVKDKAHAPKHALHYKAALQKEYDLLKVHVPAIVAHHAKTYRGTYLPEWFNSKNLTASPSIWNEQVKMIESVVINTTTWTINPKDVQMKIEGLIRALNLPFISMSFNFGVLLQSLTDAYPMLSFLDIKYVPVGQSQKILDYVAQCGK